MTKGRGKIIKRLIIRDIYTGEDIEQPTPYWGPGPGAGTGVHRYCFLLFKQLEGLQIVHAMPHRELKDRRNFDLNDFIDLHQLEPVGANFFLCEAEE